VDWTRASSSDGFRSYHSSWKEIATSKAEAREAAALLRSSSSLSSPSGEWSKSNRPPKSTAACAPADRRRQHLERMKRSWGLGGAAGGGIKDMGACVNNQLSAEDFLGAATPRYILGV
jgi:hypothetical protein